MREAQNNGLKADGRQTGRVAATSRISTLYSREFIKHGAELNTQDRMGKSDRDHDARQDGEYAAEPNGQASPEGRSPGRPWGLFEFEGRVWTQLGETHERIDLS
jgi:hypothetical protein